MTMRDDLKRLAGLVDAGEGLAKAQEPEGISAARGVAYFDGAGEVAGRTVEQVQEGTAAPAVPDTVVAQVSNEVQGESAGARPAAQGVQLSDFDKAVQASYETLKAGEWPEYQSLSGITGLFDCTTGEGVRLAFGESVDAQPLPVYRSNCRQGLKPGWDSVAAYREDKIVCEEVEVYVNEPYGVSGDCGANGTTITGCMDYYATQIYPQVIIYGWRITKTAESTSYRGTYIEFGALNQFGGNEFLFRYYLSYPLVLPDGWAVGTLLGWDGGATPNPIPGEIVTLQEPDTVLELQCEQQDFEACENGETDPNAEDCNPLNLITNPCDLNPN